MRSYDALLYRDKPDLGIDQVFVVYHMHLHVFRREDGVADADLTPQHMIDEIVESAQGRLVCLDQESFGAALDPRVERQGGLPRGSFREATEWFIGFARRLRQAKGGSGIRFGYYGIAPWWDHPHREPGRDRRDLATLGWSRDDLGRFRDTGIVDLVDVLFPSQYVMQVDWEQHIERSRERLELAASVLEKPICPFVWGLWHNMLPEIGAKPLPIEWAQGYAEMLRPMMDDMRVEAPVLWGGHPTVKWDDPAWVRAFIEA